MNNQSIKDVQDRILEIMKFIDKICRDNNITYYIMGGTALGAVRHGGFIPWDDDLDIFMTPENYKKFKCIFEETRSNKLILQEWKTSNKYLEYAKIRMNGTTFIEKNLKEYKDIHHGIYVDIMILHKAPKTDIGKKIVYLQSKYVTLYGLSQRNWEPKNIYQKYMLNLLKIIPNSIICELCYKNIYRYDERINFKEYCYWITPAKYSKGIFKKEVFQKPINIKFEDTYLYAPSEIEDYLKNRYGDYMKMPSLEEQKIAIHAEIYDVNKSYENYI